jgi:HPt (histidine-containing phosphotransfer) domain-containing protein
MTATACDLLLIGLETEDLAATLRALDHRVFPIARIEAALAMIRARSFDLLFVAGPPADATMTAAIKAIRALDEVRAAMTPLLAWDRWGHEAETFRTAGADRVLSGPLNDAALADLLGLQDDAAPPSQAVLEHLRGSLSEALAELEQEDLPATRLADLGHRLKGSAATFALADLAEAARQAMQAALPGHDAQALLAALRRETALALEVINHRLNR